MKFIKGFLKKIISIITVVVVLASSLLWLVPTASAAEIDGVEYQYKLSRDVSIIPSEFIASLELDPTQDVLFLANVTINISNGMSGTGEIGYNAAANSFYVYIYKYGVEGAYWALKYDSSGQWKYRGSADDYTNDSSNYYNYNDSATDIYFAINKENYDLIFTTLGIAEDVSTSAIEWTAYFYNGDELFTTKNTTGTLVMPTPTIDKAGYSWKGWTDGTNTYQAGQTVTIHSSTVYHAVWEANAIEWTVYFYNGDELFTTKNTTGTLVMPAPTIDKAGYSWKGWTDGTNTYQAGDTCKITDLKSLKLTAVWEAEDEVFPDVTFNYLIADLDYELKQDDCSELMNAYFELQNTLAVTQGTTQVLATGTLTTNFGALSGTYNIVLDRSFKYIYFKNIATGQTILKIDSSGYWYYRVYSNQGNAGEYKKLSDYGGEFWFSFTNDDADVFPQVLVTNEAVTVLNSAEAGSYESGYMAGLKDGYKNGYDSGYDMGYDEGYDAGFIASKDKTFIGKFIDELYSNLKDAFDPLLSYQLPIINFSVRDIVVFVFSVLCALIVAKIIGKFL